jgi:hypothetical protein
MVSLDCHTSRAGDATLVELLVTADTPTRVRIENCLDGPVWPPRKQSVPAEGWDEDGFEGKVRDRLVLGYATPAEPADTPARIVTTEPATDADSALTPRDLVRSLGDPRPPRDAVERNPDDAVVQPEAVTDWLDAVECRLDAADRLASADSVSEANAAITAVGETADILALREQLRADRRTLTRVRARCEALSERTATVEIPVDTLSRLV